MIINKSILLRNENGYRFHSHQSTANLNLRTQSATIPNTLIAKVLYIYKKWKCVESLTVSRWMVDSQKRSCHIGYINHTASLLNINQIQSTEETGKFTLIRIARCNGWAGQTVKSRKGFSKSILFTKSIDSQLSTLCDKILLQTFHAVVSTCITLTDN